MFSCIFIDICAIGSKLTIESINIFNPCNCNAVDIILCVICVPAICNYNTVNIGLAIGINTVEDLATLTFEYAINNSIVVSCCRNNGSPVDDRITSALVTLTGRISSSVINIFLRTAVATYAENSACVAIGSTGSFLVLSCACNVNMVTPLVLTNFLYRGGWVFLNPVPVGIIMSICTITVHFG